MRASSGRSDTRAPTAEVIRRGRLQAARDSGAITPEEYTVLTAAYEYGRAYRVMGRKVGTRAGAEAEAQVENAETNLRRAVLRGLGL